MFCGMGRLSSVMFSSTGPREGEGNETGSVAGGLDTNEATVEQRIPWLNSVRNGRISLVTARLLRISEPQATMFDGYGANETLVFPVAGTTSSRQRALSASEASDGGL